VDSNYLDLGINKRGFVHTLPMAGLTRMLVLETTAHVRALVSCVAPKE
jgi:hypothetical protein